MTRSVKGYLTKSARRRAQLPEGAPIPSTEFVSWIWKGNWQIRLLLVYYYIVVPVPIILIWTVGKKLKLGFKIGITIALPLASAFFFSLASGRNVFCPWKRATFLGLC